ncbi:PAS domain-containing protein [Haloarcula pelagica]|uniref:PAS domain-containing protein n=1 Tax=Haloarcula pelagica TaxID=3033389 RepID=UPI0024C41188|nr:PAS domain-containing protein [Halomicroarcula sp. YJ-61-S]
MVSAEAFPECRDRLREWKREQRPTMAPVLLLVPESVPDPWSRYGDSLGRALDGILTIPSSKRAIRARVDGLVAIRQYSLIASQRWKRLELYGRAMDNADIGISIADAQAEDEHLIYVNQGFVDITGYSLPDALGRNCRFLQGEGTDESTVAEIRTAIDARESVSVVIRNYRRDGEAFWNQLDIVPVYDDAGTVTHFLGFQQDVTEQIERKRLLEQYEHVFESVSDPVVVLRADTTVVHANAAATDVFEVDFRATPTTALTDILPSEQASVVRRACRVVVETGRTQERELTLTLPTGQSRTFQVKFEHESVSDSAGDRVIAIARDISAIRAQQGRLTVLDRVLRHNFRNKLTVVSGRAEHVAANAEEMDPASISEAAEAIQTASDELLDTADAVRQFHLGSDPDQSSVPLDVPTLVRSAVGDLRAVYPGVEFTVAGAPAASAICPAQLELCLEQLVEHAVGKWGAPAGQVSLQVTDEPPSPSVELAVRFPGMAFSEIERSALDAGSESPLEHTQGIRLWLVKWAVENAGGGLSVENTDDGGVVTLYLRRSVETDG